MNVTKYFIPPLVVTYFKSTRSIWINLI